MNTELVKQAVALFIETLPLDAEGVDVGSAQFHHLYSQECKLYDCIRRMSEGEREEYGRQIADVDPEVESILVGLNNMIQKAVHKRAE